MFTDFIAPTIMSFLKQGFAWVFGVGIAWWFWVLVGLIGGVVIFLLLPAVLPERWRTLLAGLAMMVGAVVGAGSWGIDFGSAQRDEYWQLERSKEVARLKLGFEQQKGLEAQRGLAASTFVGAMQEELRGVIAEVDTASTPEGLDPSGNPKGEGRLEHPRVERDTGSSCRPGCIAVPAPIVERMRKWSTRRPPSLADDTP